MLNSSYNSLTRSQTPTSRPTPSPKCFGTTNYVLKEDHERERVRWQQKLEEAEEKLAEAAISTSELFQVKAELNRKIVDFEKNQRPLIEQNRRLSERNRNLNNEIKKLEDKVSRVRDDFLSLRDAFDRLGKENTLLKEQRAFPEKLEELERYRNQVLDYSKCITALRQSAAEKDRRYELLVQRFKKLKRCVTSTKRNGTDEDDRNSCIGSECSMDSSIGLDTITEDLDEDVYTNPILFPLEMNTPMTATEYSLTEQLQSTTSTINELQQTIDSQSAELRLSEERRRQLESELANAHEHNDLLEFQLVEMSEVSQHRDRAFADKQCGTERFVSQEDLESEEENEFPSGFSLTKESIQSVKDALTTVRKDISLYMPDRRAIRHGIECINMLEAKLEFLTSQLNMSECEISRLAKAKEEELIGLRRSFEEDTSAKQLKKKELQAEVDRLKKEKAEEFRRSSLEVRKLMEFQQGLSNELAEKSAECRQLEGKIATVITAYEKDTQLSKERLDLQESTTRAMEEELEKLRQERDELKKEATNVRERCRELDNSLEEQKRHASSASEQSERSTKELTTQMNDYRLELEQLRDRCEKYEHEKRDEEVARCSLSEQFEREKIQLETSLTKERERLQQELEEALGEVDKLKAQIRPIGTQLERRYEETRYRLSEALRMVHEYEKLIEEMKKREEQQGHERCLEEIQQLKTYNHELEAQFNSQMEIIAALKKKFILMQGKTNSTDSIGWTSNCSDGTNSMDDEQYHSEGSTEGGLRQKP